MSDSNALTVYERMSDPLAAIKTLGLSIAKSGMYGVSTVEAGEVLAMECLHQNTPPLSILRRFNIMFGRLSMKAEAMLAGFEQEGGKYKVVSRTPDLAAVEMTINGQTTLQSLSWDDAQGEPFVYEGKESEVVKQLASGNKPALKPKYATPRSRMQMLWARLVSDSVRFLCPRVVTGVYTPEEIEDWSESEEVSGCAKKNGHTKTVAASPSVVDQAEAAAKQAAIDVPFETKQPVEPPPAESAAQSPTQSAPLSYDEQPACVQMRQGIEEMFAALGMTVEQQQAALAKRGVNSLRSLTNGQGAELMGKLKEVFFAREKARQQTPVEPGNEPVYSCSGQCTVEQEQRIKAALTEWAQINNAEYTAEMTAFKQKLVASGRQKIIDLSANDAARLYDAIQSRKLSSFCQRSLEEWKPKTTAAATG